ncbi:MAG TPA: TonB-dependent receptor [Bacteroidetes bacterium]|nr:TonB-dependent receptor [Bacteroidota bacterium]
MKTKYLLIFSILLSISNSTFAQLLEIKGRITENTSSEVLPGASISLYSIYDTAMIKGTFADPTGHFKLEKLNTGNYFIVCSFIGFINDTLSINLNTNRYLGDIALRASTLLLDEVKITGRKSIYQNHLDKKVYNVQKDILSETSSVSEILQNIPSVNVDINRKITIRNTSNITFFINGKPSALLRKNPSAILEQTLASSIERIEIITNPSAKYRPDGVGGIINIVLKKDADKGLSGHVRSNVGNEGRYNANISLNYGSEDLKLFGNYGIRHSNASILYTDERTYKDNLENHNSFYSEDGNSKTNALSHNAFIGANYDINDFNNIEISGNYFIQNSYHDGSSEISSLDKNSNTDYNFTNIQTNKELEEEGEANLTYEHSFKNNEDHTLTFEAVYSSYNEKEDKTFNQNYTFPTTITETSNYIIQKSGNQQEINLEYALPLGEDAEFESGYMGEFIYDNIRYNKNGELSQFKFNQQLHAFYALFGQSIEDFSYKAGLRAEQTNINSHLVRPSDTLIPNNYFKLFPTVHLGYDIADNKNISLSYSKRVNRPDPDELNPNPEYSDPRNAEAGNPNLKPEQIHSVELGYRYSHKKYSINSSLYYRYKYDAFTGIFTNIGDSIVLYSATNLNTRQSGGIEATLSGRILKKHTYNITGDVYYTTIDATNLGYSNNKSSISGNIKAYSLIKLFKSSFLQLNGYYYFPSITPQGNRSDFYYFNLGFKQNLFKNKASLTLTVTDVFHTYKIKYNIQSAELNQTTTIQRRYPVVYVGFIWRFNNYKDKEKIDFDENGLKK